MKDRHRIDYLKPDMASRWCAPICPPSNLRRELGVAALPSAWRRDGDQRNARTERSRRQQSGDR
jgi:hypothetical protein